MHDIENQFSDQQEITIGSENGVKSTHVVDLKVARNIGDGEPVKLVVKVSELMAGAGDTLTVKLQTADNVDMNSASDIATIGTFPANSAVGTKFVVPLPSNDNYKQYIGLLYTAAGSGALEAGKFTAYLTKDEPTTKVYPKGYVIA